MQNILFMFLGDIPNNGDAFEHWKNMITKEPKELLEHIYIVVHPKEIDGKMDKYYYWKKTFGDRFMIVDTQHHIKTVWFTKSLSDATLLMIQYAHKKGQYKKYILLSPTCCPIVSLNYVYQITTNVNKSWLAIFTLSFPNGKKPGIIKEYGGLHNINELYGGSQWMILDRRHVDFFFIGYNDTYIKDNNINQCQYGQIEQIIVNPKYESNIKYNELRLLLASHNGGNYRSEFFEDSNISTKGCAPSDEYFFIQFIIHKIFKIKNVKTLRDCFDAITDNIYYHYVDDEFIEMHNSISESLESMTYTESEMEQLNVIPILTRDLIIEENVYDNLIQKDQNSNILIKPIMILMTNNMVEKLKKIIGESGDINEILDIELDNSLIANNKLFNCNNENKLVNIVLDTQNGKFIEKQIDPPIYCDYKKYESNQVNNIKIKEIDQHPNNDKLIEINNIMINGIQKILNNTPSTNADIIFRSRSPYSILRGLKITKEFLGHDNLKWITFDLESFLKNNPYSNILWLQSADEEYMEKYNKTIFNRNDITLDTYYLGHPREYYTITFYEFVNCILLLSYFKNHMMLHSKVHKHNYTNILKKYIPDMTIDFDIKCDSVNKKVIIKENLPDDKELQYLESELGLKFGDVIYINKLIPSIASGSFFIRKCMPSCKINLSSDIIYGYSELILEKSLYPKFVIDSTMICNQCIKNINTLDDVINMKNVSYFNGGNINNYYIHKKNKYIKKINKINRI